MYYHRDMTHRVDWEPDDNSIAYQAIAQTTHTVVSSVSEAKSECPVEVTKKEARDISQLYRDLLPDTSNNNTA